MIGWRSLTAPPASRVVLELVDDDDVRLAAAEQGLAWNAWVTHGPDGPIEEDAGEPRVSVISRGNIRWFLRW